MIIAIPSFKRSVICCALLSALLLFPNMPFAHDFSDWSNGASGYEDTFDEARDEEQPLILYFHTKWCKWCKKMNATYLADDDMDDFLSEIPKVEINPDDGRDEKALAKKYRVTGYPTFLVSVPSIDKKQARLYPFRKGTDWTTDEFIDAIRERIAAAYNKKGYSCYKSKRYEEAVEYCNLTLNYYPENAYAFYLKGIVLQTVAWKNRNTDLLKEAEENYQKALDIDPGHKDCKKQLKRLHKTMDKLGVERD